MNTIQPQIQLVGALEVGQILAASNGAWTGSPTYSRQWYRDGTVIPGATTVGYTIVDADVGAMIGLTITGTNAGGSSSASADPVGPCIEAAPLGSRQSHHRP